MTQVTLLLLGAGGLVWFARHPGQRAGLLGFAVVVLGLLFVSPVVVQSKSMTQGEFARDLGQPVEPLSAHTMDVLGLPLMRIELDHRRSPSLSGLAENTTTEDLMARWRIAGVLLRGHTKVGDMCGDVSNPCWKTFDRPQRPMPVRMWRQAASTLRVQVLTLGQAPPEGLVLPSTYPNFGGWELTTGPSGVGLAYWLLCVPAWIFLAIRRRRRW